ncbi:MAG: DUF4388 domain-containing protein [Candidatus Methylacidiphilales bacterium]|nr:DUF4388 domain-containing protein [Candidatus Methylacidiphilales bacterium]
MLKGSLDQVSIVEVFRLLSSSNQTGQLHLMNMTDSVATGGCYFQMGKWVHATLGRFSGLDALKEICRMNEGSFAFEAGVSSPEQTLAQYPTPALIDMVKEQVEELQALRKAAPAGHEVPRYLPGKVLDGLEATPEELSVLLQCDGVVTVLEIAQRAGLNPVDLRATLAKFRLLGLIEILPGAGAPAATVEPPSPVDSAAPEASAAPKQVRYWRGKPVHE